MRRNNPLIHRKVTHSRSNRFIRLNHRKDMVSRHRVVLLNSQLIRPKTRDMHRHRNKATLRHNPSNPRHLPNRSLMSIHCPICPKDRLRMREEQMTCRFSRTEDWGPGT